MGNETGPNKNAALLIDETTLVDFSPRGGRKNLQGEDITPPEMVLSFAAEMDRFEGKLNKIGHLYKEPGAVRLWLEFVENLELGLADDKDHPRVTDQLGTFPKNGENAAAAHDVLGQEQDERDEAEPTSIGKAKRK